MNEKDWPGLTDSVDTTGEKLTEDLQEEQEAEDLKWPGDLESLQELPALNPDADDAVNIEELFGPSDDEEMSFEERWGIPDLLAGYNDSKQESDDTLNFPHPEIDDEEDGSMPPREFRKYMKHKAWSQVLADEFGYEAAIAFVNASDRLLDQMNESLYDLSSMPRGTHVGQLDFIGISEMLPRQFAMHYDYDFIYYLKSVLLQYRYRAQRGMEMYAHTVAEELILYLCLQHIEIFIDMNQDMSEEEAEEFCEPDYSTEWIFDLLGDMDIVTYLYSDFYLDEMHPYHISHWGEPQFYLSDSFRNEGQKK